MARLPLELPLLQNWSCHNCSGCCRQHLVTITDAERERIERQGWSAADGVPADRPVVVRQGSGWRLNHQADGACVFLDERGLCRIHAKFGEPAKPLACRVYPYALHPAGKKVTVSLRFSCPSVAANLGRPVSEQMRDLQAIAKAVVPDGAERTPPPAIHATQRLDWPDFLRFPRTLDEIFAPDGTPLPVRLLRALTWVQLIGEMQFQALKGERLAELLDIIRDESRLQVSEIPVPERPRRSGRGVFRMLAAQYARRDTARDLDSGWRGRWRLLKSAVRFARGRGRLPVLHEGLQPVPFAALEASPSVFPSEADEMLTRYFRVKTQGLHFCGAAYYGVPFVEGCFSLLLVFPVVMWQARWLAAGDGRGEASADDVATALTVADHHFGYSAAFGGRTLCRGVRMLARTGDIRRLVSWYGQSEPEA